MFETSCKIDISFYPYDTQVCSLIFGTWTYTSFKMNMTNSTEQVIMYDYNTSGEWHITGTSVDRLEFVYDCCPNSRFSKVEASIYLKRRHRFYTLNLVLPCAMLSSLTLVTFLSPPDQGEKISLGISILLSFNVFMLSLSENMPKTSETLPLFSKCELFCNCNFISIMLVGIYTTFVMLMNTWSVMLTVLVLNLHHRNEDKPVPQWVRTLVFEGIARMLCMYSKDHLRRSEYRKEAESSLYAQANGKKRSIVDPFQLGRKNRDSKEGYSLAFAAAQFTGQMHKSMYVPGTPGTSNCADSSPPKRGSTTSSETFNNVKNSIKQSPNTERRNKEMEHLLHKDYYISLELQEWKRLARVVDRLFFWLTLLALICVSVGMLCILWT